MNPEIEFRNASVIRVPCDSCGAPGCEPEGDRCGCGYVICAHCADDGRLNHFLNGEHRLLNTLGLAGADGSAIQQLQDRIVAWQRKQFPNQTVQGQLNHLRHEVREVQKDPNDLTEWADVLILFLGSAGRNFFVTQDLIAAAHAKMAINEKRQWPAEADKDGVFHHIEKGE